MNKKQLEKMKKARDEGKEKAKEVYGLVCKLDDGVDKFEIWADKYQYILIINDNEGAKTYYSAIENILDDLLALKQKKLMIANREKDLLSVRQAILDSQEWMKKVVKPLLKTAQR